MEFPLLNAKGEVDEGLIGRCLADPVVNPETGEILAEAGSYLESKEQLESFKPPASRRSAIAP